MANFVEKNEYPDGVRMIETGDSVIGGVNAPINLPFAALASRTLWLKTELAKAVTSIGTNKTAAEQAYALKAITLTAGNGLTGGGTLAANCTFALGTPGKITVSTTNSVGAATHTHEIDKASTTTPGVVKLNDTLSSQSTTEALTANQGRMLKNMIDAAGLGSLVKITDFDQISGNVFFSFEGSAVNGGDWGNADGVGWQLSYTGQTTQYAQTTDSLLFTRTKDDGASWSVWHRFLNTSHLSDAVDSASSSRPATSAAVKTAYDLAAAKSTVAVITGTIADGGTIPLPAGFSEAQCKFMVSTARDNPTEKQWDIDEGGRWLHYSFECYLTGRVVTCKTYLNKNRTISGSGTPAITVPGRANYLVIGVK